MTPPTVQFIPASGPSLLIHDAFGGTGGLSGRTPDTVDNGNAWTTYNSETYTVGSGYVVASNDTSDFSKTADIDIGTSNYTVEGVFTKPSSGGSQTGLTIAVTSGTDSSETLAKFDYSSQCRCVEYSSGSSSVTNFGGVFGGTEYFIRLEVSGTSVNYYYYETDRTTLITSGSHTLSIPSANRCGIHVMGSLYACKDFKVYS